MGGKGPSLFGKAPFAARAGGPPKSPFPQKIFSRKPAVFPFSTLQGVALSYRLKSRQEGNLRGRRGSFRKGHRGSGAGCPVKKPGTGRQVGGKGPQQGDRSSSSGKKNPESGGGSFPKKPPGQHGGLSGGRRKGKEEQEAQSGRGKGKRPKGGETDRERAQRRAVKRAQKRMVNRATATPLRGQWRKNGG